MFIKFQDQVLSSDSGLYQLLCSLTSIVPEKDTWSYFSLTLQLHKSFWSVSSPHLLLDHIERRAGEAHLLKWYFNITVGLKFGDNFQF